MNTKLKYYPRNEEILNIITHGLGVFLGFLGGCFLIYKDYIENKDIYYFIGHLIYGFSVFLLYLFSTLYHSSSNHKSRIKFRALDHATIYLLIAGSYTPFLLIKLRNSIGIDFMIILWIIAILGICYEILFLGKYKVLSIIFYVLAGWSAMIYAKTFRQSLGTEIMDLVIVGGSFYFIGTLFYVIKKIPFNHAIWHCFVLAGSLIHYISILKL